MKKIGYILLLLAGYGILLGGIADIAMTFVMQSLPTAHLAYLHINNYAMSQQLKNLDFALLRAVGACLIALGVGVLTIIYATVRKNIFTYLPAMLFMVTIGEGTNSLEMYLIHSPYFVFPLTCVLLTWAGAILWWAGNKKEI